MSDKNDNKNMMDQWFDMQKKAFEVWQDKMLPKDEKDNKAEEKKETVFPQMELFNQWNQAMSKMVKEGMGQLNPNYGFNFMTQPFGTTNPFTAVPYLPHPIQDLYQESLKMQKKLFSGFDDPYQSMLNQTKELHAIMYRGMMGDKEAIFDYMDFVLNNSKKIAGQLMPMVNFDSNDQWMQMQTKSMNKLVDYYNGLISLNERISKVGHDSFNAVMSQYQDFLKKGVKQDSFQNFYSFWWEQNEKAYKELFGKDDFNSLLDQITEFGKEFKASYDEMLEQQLQLQPFATKKDIEELKQMIEDLKKQIKK
jgi:hypothetical protein